MDNRIIFMIVLLISLVGCAQTQQAPEPTTPLPVPEVTIEDLPPLEGDFPNWMTVPFQDIRTGNYFRIADFEGKPILFESFAVWCPTCTRQQNEVKKLHDMVGEDIVSISLDTDPNEDAERIRTHLERNGFNWYYAISPPEVTRELITEFGIGIVNAPSVPMVLICPDMSRTLLRSGIKSPEDLLEAVAGCASS